MRAAVGERNKKERLNESEKKWEQKKTPLLCWFSFFPFQLSVFPPPYSHLPLFLSAFISCLLYSWTSYFQLFSLPFHLLHFLLILHTLGYYLSSGNINTFFRDRDFVFCWIWRSHAKFSHFFPPFLRIIGQTWTQRENLATARCHPFYICHCGPLLYNTYVCVQPLQRTC